MTDLKSEIKKDIENFVEQRGQEIKQYFKSRLYNWLIWLISTVNIIFAKSATVKYIGDATLEQQIVHGNLSQGQVTILADRDIDLSAYAVIQFDTNVFLSIGQGVSCFVTSAMTDLGQVAIDTSMLKSNTSQVTCQIRNTSGDTVIIKQGMPLVHLNIVI